MVGMNNMGGMNNMNLGNIGAIGNLGGNLNNLNNLAFQQDYQKINSDTSSITISSDQNKPTIKHRLFNSTNCANINKDDGDNNDFSTKKRKRYIKNNKFVYVHPGSAAAKKLELEKINQVNKK